MKKKQPKNHHLTIRLTECQHRRLLTHLRNEKVNNTISKILRESLHQYLNNESNKPKIN